MTESSEEKNKRSAFDFFNSADGVPIRYGFWPCPPSHKVGTVLLLTGRREFMEKYGETIGELKYRNYDVYSMDWRGQGLSGRETPNPHKGYVADYQHYLDDLDMLIEKKIRPRSAGPLIALAHSMGGHILLRYLYGRPAGVERALLTAPMIDICFGFFSAKLLRRLSRLAVRLGMSQRYTIGSGDYVPSDERFADNRLTSDPGRFLIEQRAIAENPDLALGGVTNGWLAATFQSIDIVMDPFFAGKITTPITIVRAGAERIVSNRAQQEICARIPGCVLKTISGARHEILNESDSIRAEFWREFDRFVGATRPVPPAH